MMPVRWILLLVIVPSLVCVASLAAAKQPELSSKAQIPGNSRNVELVGQIGGATNAVAVQGSYAYIGIGPRLVVLDVSNPSVPAKVGQSAVLPGIVQDVFVSGTTVYVADGDVGGLRIINVADRTNPVVAGFCDTPGSAQGVVVLGSIAYVADGEVGLRMIDVANSTNPVDVGFFDTLGYAMGVSVADQYAYVADGTSGLRIIDTTNPARPVEVGVYDTPGEAKSVTVVDGYAYVADRLAGLRVIDVANPSIPTEVGVFDTGGWAEDIAIVASTVYVADNFNGLRVIDVADPLNPAEVGLHYTPGLALGVAAVGNHAYVVIENHAGLRVFDGTDPANPEEIGAYDTPSAVVGVAVATGFAYVTDEAVGLHVINVMNPANPLWIATNETPFAEGLALAGGYAYVASGHRGLWVIRVTNPANPVEVANLDTPGYVRDVTISGTYAYLADRWAGLRVVNVVNPATPSAVGSLDTPGAGWGVAVASGHAYVADWDGGLRIIDITNAANPVEVASYPQFGPVGVAVRNDNAYVAAEYDGLWVINITNPANPVQVGSFDTPGEARDVAVTTEYAYVADRGAGLRVISVLDPADPVEAGYYDTPGNAVDVVAIGSYAYVADEKGGLVVLRYTGDDPTPTPTPTKTPTNTSTPTQTPTPTATPIPMDSYEPDDTCSQASSIPIDGTVQVHTFHAQADADWVRFDAVAGREFLVEAQVPPGSPADVVLEVYDQCAGLPVATQDYTFTPGVRLAFDAPVSGPIYLKLVNHQPEVAGPQVAYELSVLALAQEPQPGALILVAGRNRSGDPLQANIHHVTDSVYTLFRNHGYDDNRITYLATESRPGRDGLPTASNLQAAITAWALDKVGPDRALTLYLMDHGTTELIYLDKPSYQWVSPAQLNTWLSQLEAARPGVRINVIVEACQSGGFVDRPQSASGPGRVVLASTGPDRLAWASATGAVFSDHLLETLGQGASLYSAFQAAAWAVEQTGHPQTPWLDGDGDGLPNEPADQAEAVRRGFAYAGTLGDERWPPYIAAADAIQVDDDGRGRLRVQVRDDVAVQRVWALIYPPSYRPPATQEELVWENVASVNLFREGASDWFSTTYPGFDERGTYRVVFYADDAEDLDAQPLPVSVSTGSALYLPLVVR